SIVLVEDGEQWEKVRRVREHLPRLRHIVLMRGTRVDDAMTLDWDSFLTRGNSVAEAEVDGRLEALKPEQLATLIYTSGTVGPPKGVMLSHHNHAGTAEKAIEVGRLSQDDSTPAYVPVSHVA